MTVKDLIKKLETMNPNSIVVYDDGYSEEGLFGVDTIYEQDFVRKEDLDAVWRYEVPSDSVHELSDIVSVCIIS